MTSIAIIGAGPCGMSAITAFNKEIINNKDAPKFKVTCFEQQSDIGGLWNYTWQTGTNEYGYPVHCSQYKHLWSNGPKECLEMADYTFLQHFGKNIGSFPPRVVLKDYLIGRYNYFKNMNPKFNEYFDIKFKHRVVDVKPIKTKNDENKDENKDNENKNNSDGFSITYKDLTKNSCFTETFTHIIIATGHFSIPNIVKFEGFDEFDGRIMHSHDFRNANEFKNQNILVIGSSYSAEDIGLQCWKFGCKSVTISYRTNAMGFKWPDSIKEYPLLTKISKNGIAQFKDGSKVENINSVILCTGYLHHFPFLKDCDGICLKTTNIMAPKNLYKGVIWIDSDEDGNESNNNNVFYLGVKITRDCLSVLCLWFVVWKCLSTMA